MTKKFILTDEDITCVMGPVDAFESGQDFVEFAYQEISGYGFKEQFGISEPWVETCIEVDEAIRCDRLIPLRTLKGNILISNYYFADVEW